MEEKEVDIVKELNTCQGVKIDLGGYYKVDEKKTEAAMRPCQVWNDILAKYGKMAEEAAAAAPAAPAAVTVAPVAPEDVKIQTSGSVSPSKGGNGISKLCGCFSNKSSL